MSFIVREEWGRLYSPLYLFFPSLSAPFPLILPLTKSNGYVTADAVMPERPPAAKEIWGVEDDMAVCVTRRVL